MRISKEVRTLLFALLLLVELHAQDPVPVCPSGAVPMKAFRPLRELKIWVDTLPVQLVFPAIFKETGNNQITDSLGVLSPILEHLRLIRGGVLEDTVRILHIGDSHIRGHIYPQTTGQKLAQTFGAVSYTDMGVNGATCLTFTHPDRIAAMAATNPQLVILSFGTNESHNRRYDSHLHYQQMKELVSLIRDSLPDVPILLTTPPGSYESFRKKRRSRTYAVNPRTIKAVNTIREFARDGQFALWDLYNVAGGSENACKNWQAAGLMRPDHVHFMPEGYVLQGSLLYEAIIKAYNDYVSH